MRIRLVLLAAAIIPALHASSIFSSASVTFPGGCPSGNVDSTVTGQASASTSAYCTTNGPYGTGIAEALSGPGALWADAGVSGSSYLAHSVADASYSSEALFAGSGIGYAVFFYQVDVNMATQGGFPSASFLIQTATGSSGLTFASAGHITKSSQVFTSDPIPITLGIPFTYTARAEAVADGGQGMGSSTISATLIGIADPPGAEVPEPASVLLVGGGLLIASYGKVRGRRAGRDC